MRNGFCFLTDSLPRYFSNGDKAIEFDTTTSTAIAILLYLNENHTADEKAQYVSQKLFGKTLKQILTELDITEVQFYKKISFFLSGYPTTHKTDGNEEKTAIDGSKSKSDKTNSFDYIQDSDAIISAFRQVYHLTMNETRNLHWWEFLALLSNLSDESCSFVYKVSTRLETIPPKASPEMRQSIIKRKKAVALVDTRTKEQRQAQGYKDIDNIGFEGF